MFKLKLSNRPNQTHWLFIAILILLMVSNVKAQKSSDLFIIKTKKSVFGFTIYPESFKKITKGKYYDKQPNFINKNQLVFTSADKSGNFDIIMYNINSQKFTNMTRTPNLGEFSPSLTNCGQYISAVRVEKDSVQRLWLYPINFGEPELLYDDIQPVGYYGWMEDTAALYVIGTPNKLVYPYSREDIHEIAQNTGRCIKSRPGTDEIAYLDKGANIVSDGRETYELKAFDVKSRKTTTLGLALGNAEDFYWLDKNNILMARENSIFLKNISKGTDWKKIATLNIPEYKNISRIALSPDNKHLVITMETIN